MVLKRFRPDEIRRALRSTYAIDLGRGVESLVYVAGTRRSGTTWLAELINARNEYRVIFEPFHNRWGPFAGTWQDRYVRPGSQDPELRARVERILRGEFRHDWSGRHNKKLVARRRLIKDIHTNLMLAWFRSEFPAFPIVFIVRHPCAVAHSNLRVNFEAELDVYLSQPELREDHLAPFVAEIEAAEDEFDRQIFQWSIENYIPLRQLEPNLDAHFVFYENLVRNPHTELERLFDYVGSDYDDGVLALVGRPSQTTWRSPDEEFHEMRQAATAWRAELERTKTRRAHEIVSIFGLDQLYDEEGLPREFNSWRVTPA